MTWCSGAASISGIAALGVAEATSPPQQLQILHTDNGNAQPFEWLAAFVNCYKHLQCHRAPPPPSARNASMTTKRRARPIQDALANPLVAGAHSKWCGSPTHQKLRNHIRHYYLSRSPKGSKGGTSCLNVTGPATSNKTLCIV